MTAAVACTIAGSDSGGGAGIQADLKTFAACGVYGASAIVALTAQNTVGVRRVTLADLAMVADQIDAIAEDLHPKAWKTGMLGSTGTVEVVAERLRHHGAGNLVVDPVMIAKSGDVLLEPPAIAAMRELLMPLATVLTPNLPEAAELLGRPVEGAAAAAEAAAPARNTAAARTTTHSAAAAAAAGARTAAAAIGAAGAATSTAGGTAGERARCAGAAEGRTASGAVAEPAAAAGPATPASATHAAAAADSAGGTAPGCGVRRQGDVGQIEGSGRADEDGAAQARPAAAAAALASLRIRILDGEVLDRRRGGRKGAVELSRAADEEDAECVGAADRDVLRPAIDDGAVAEDQREFIIAGAADRNGLAGDCIGKRDRRAGVGIGEGDGIAQRRIGIAVDCVGAAGHHAAGAGALRGRFRCKQTRPDQRHRPEQRRAHHRPGAWSPQAGSICRTRRCRARTAAAARRAVPSHARDVNA
jgi:hydroxymethylpyrimidine kinase/phosphomethylpyrimidine kinase